MVYAYSVAVKCVFAVTFSGCVCGVRCIPGVVFVLCSVSCITCVMFVVRYVHLMFVMSGAHLVLYLVLLGVRMVLCLWC